jgi:UrcA family protein
MLRSSSHLSSGLIAAACAIGLGAVWAPAFGQEPVSTVMGHRVADGGRVLSATVSYRDLDLRTSDGQAQLHHRVWRTAERLCSRAGENHIGGASMAMSCEDQTMLSTTQERRDAIARAMAAVYPVSPTLAAADGPSAAASVGLTG